MTTTRYPLDRTGLLLVDPYNDFRSEGGKLWPMVKGMAAEENLLKNLRQIVAAARAAKLETESSPGALSDHFSICTLTFAFF